MRLFIFLLLLSGFNIVTLAADQTTIKRDTIETIIYEYDTVYVSPDTIRITDTIVNYQTIKPLYINMSTQHWSIGANFLVLGSNFFGEKSVIDSFKEKNTINYSYTLNFQYYNKGFMVGLGGGITNIHDRIKYQQIHNTLIADDSISIVNNCISDNYFRYLNLSLSMGKEWGKRKIHYALSASFITDILIDYKAVLPISEQVYNKIFDTSVRKIGLAVMLSPSVIYRIGKKVDFCISPCYRYTLNKRNFYPLSNLQDLGIGAGLNLKL